MILILLKTSIFRFEGITWLDYNDSSSWPWLLHEYQLKWCSSV